MIAIIAEVAPDVLLINEFDYDVEGRAADLFTARLAEAGMDYPHHFTSPPNTGTLSGHDLNGDGKLGTPDDAFGYGRFPGQYGMLLLSRYPVIAAEARTFAELLWKDLPDAQRPGLPGGGLFPSDEAADAMRLSSKSHWDVPLDLPGGRLHVFASHPTPPVFDGPEDRNGLRNADEIRFWIHYLDRVELPDDTGLRAARSEAPFVILGDLNADPEDGDGRHEGVGMLLAHPDLRDPLPASAGGTAATERQGGANADHTGDPALDTADWRDEPGPGNLRVDYVLPSRDLNVIGSGVFWPTPDDPAFRLIGSGKPVSSDHRLVWIDIDY